jgi:hypothetical protein
MPERAAMNPNTTPSNPSAFPVPNDVLFHPNTKPGECGYEFGMTLRDYFAAKAMQGMVGTNPSWHHLASKSYEIADAMLSERAKGQS